MPQHGGVNTFEEYLSARVGESLRAVERAIDFKPTTLGRHIRESLRVETVVAICRAYRLDLAEAFVAAGFITEDEADRLGTARALAGATDRQLVEEMLRRVEAGEATAALTEPIEVEDPDYENVSDPAAYDLAAKREERDIAPDELPNEP